MRVRRALVHSARCSFDVSFWRGHNKIDVRDLDYKPINMTELMYSPSAVAMSEVVATWSDNLTALRS